MMMMMICSSEASEEGGGGCGQEYTSVVAFSAGLCVV